MNQLVKIINRIVGSGLLIASLTGSALRMHFEGGFSKPSLLNLIPKDAHLVFTIFKDATSVNAIILTNENVILAILHHSILMTNLPNAMQTM